MGVFLRQKGDLLVRNPQQQPSIQEAYHHKSFARSQRHLGLHDQRAARQGPRARQKIESSVTPHQPDRQPEQGQEQKKNAHGLHIAAPAERGLAEIEAVELAHIIERFLDTLTVENRVLFMRRYWFSDSCRDIAGLIGLTEKNVSVRLTRIREKLRQYLIEREVFI